MVTFVAPTIKIGIILSRMVLICFGLINNRLRITAEINSRIKTKPTAPKIGVVCLMKTNALLQTAESPMIETQSIMAGLFFKKLTLLEILKTFLKKASSDNETLNF